jgi:hypothetical protein
MIGLSPLREQGSARNERGRAEVLKWDDGREERRAERVFPPPGRKMAIQ